MTSVEVSNSGHHLLVVDDDDRIRELLREYLVRAGFRISTANSGASARGLMATLDFDLAIFDVMMPGEDGFSLMRWLRERRGTAASTPVLMLTARGLPQDRIEGLKLGADDYLAKPFEPEELLLRIEAILRRARARPAPTTSGLVSLGRCQFDPGRGELFCEGVQVRLTEAEVALLRRLARDAHQPVERMDLARETVDPSGRAVDIQVTRLRRKIEADPAHPTHILTEPGIGYRFQVGV